MFIYWRAEERRGMEGRAPRRALTANERPVVLERKISLTEIVSAFDICSKDFETPWPASILVSTASSLLSLAHTHTHHFHCCSLSLIRGNWAMGGLECGGRMAVQRGRNLSLGGFIGTRSWRRERERGLLKNIFFRTSRWSIESISKLWKIDISRICSSLFFSF